MEMDKENTSVQNEMNPLIYSNLAKSDEFKIDENVGRFEIGKSYYDLGKLFYDKADLAQAEENFIKAYQCTEKPRDTFTIFKIFGFLIRIASERLENDKAMTYINEAQRLSDEFTRTLGSLNAEYFYNIGSLGTYRGDFEEARINYELAYKKSKEENEPELLAKTLLALAVNGYNRGDYKLCLDYLNQLGNLLKIIKKKYLNGAMYLYSAKAFTELGMSERAHQAFHLATSSFQEKKCWNLYGYVLLGKGIVHKRNGQYDKALDFFELARETVDKINFRRLSELIEEEIKDVNDTSVDIYLDRTNRKVKESTLGTIDFKHRFVLLEILFLLARAPGEYFDKEHLAKEIWKDEYNPLIHDKLIYTSVSRLRKLIEPKNDRGDKRKYIIRGKDGYTFNPQTKIRFHLENGSTDASKNIGNVDLSSPV